MPCSIDPLSTWNVWIVLVYTLAYKVRGKHVLGSAHVRMLTHFRAVIFVET